MSALFECGFKMHMLTCLLLFPSILAGPVHQGACPLQCGPGYMCVTSYIDGATSHNCQVQYQVQSGHMTGTEGVEGRNSMTGTRRTIIHVRKDTSNPEHLQIANALLSALTGRSRRRDPPSPPSRDHSGNGVERRPRRPVRPMEIASQMMSRPVQVRPEYVQQSLVPLQQLPLDSPGLANIPMREAHQTGTVVERIRPEIPQQAQSEFSSWQRSWQTSKQHIDSSQSLPQMMNTFVSSNQNLPSESQPSISSFSWSSHSSQSIPPAQASNWQVQTSSNNQPTVSSSSSWSARTSGTQATVSSSNWPVQSAKDTQRTASSSNWPVHSFQNGVHSSSWPTQTSPDAQPVSGSSSWAGRPSQNIQPAATAPQRSVLASPANHIPTDSSGWSTHLSSDNQPAESLSNWSTHTSHFTDHNQQNGGTHGHVPSPTDTQVDGPNMVNIFQNMVGHKQAVAPTHVEPMIRNDNMHQVQTVNEIPTTTSTTTEQPTPATSNKVPTQSIIDRFRAINSINRMVNNRTSPDSGNLRMQSDIRQSSGRQLSNNDRQNQFINSQQAHSVINNSSILQNQNVVTTNGDRGVNGQDNQRDRQTEERSRRPTRRRGRNNGGNSLQDPPVPKDDSWRHQQRKRIRETMNNLHKVNFSPFQLQKGDGSNPDTSSQPTSAQNQSQITPHSKQSANENAANSNLTQDQGQCSACETNADCTESQSHYCYFSPECAKNICQHL